MLCHSYLYRIVMQIVIRNDCYGKASERIESANYRSPCSFAFDSAF